MSDTADIAQEQTTGEKRQGKGSAFWMTFVAIIVSMFLSALDLTAVSTALPTITKRLGGGSNFVWVGSAYSLSSTAILPLSGRLADVFGRKPVMLCSIALFAVGSAIAGAAQNMNMLIAARTVQGIGGGSILNMTEILVSDLVPLAERGIYQGMIGLTWAFASGVGPPIGGALATSAWRWLFFLNLPVTAIAFVLVLFFLRVRTPEGRMRDKLARVDWIGNAIIIAGTTVAMLGLTWAGVEKPWDSAGVLVPLILGLLLVAGFLVYEFRVPSEPTVPYDILSNKMVLSTYVATGVHGLVSISAMYYLPVYFQACFGASPIRSGVDALALALLIAPAAILAGASVQVFKRYIPANAAGWVLTIIGFGLLSMLEYDTSTGKWVGYIIVMACGVGLLYTSTVFPILAPLPVERTAASLAFYTFVRSFAQTWGITISATILQNELKKKLPGDFAAQFPAGFEIAYAAIPVISGLEEPLRSQVRAAFADSLATVWQTMIGIAGLGLLTMPFMREVQLREEVDEAYGLHVGDKVEKDVREESAATRVNSRETNPSEVEKA
ncbi:MFS general substrate transporter [Dentipellis sp. KUC8613]|nr:MFS general substrate transporter [Dentipellis sp. KUC8613]